MTSSRQAMRSYDRPTTSVELTREQIIKKLSDLRPFIAYIEATDESEWRINTVRNADNTENCLFGHLVNWFYGKDYQGKISMAWDWFEEMWSTTYQIYPINDGLNRDYQQPTPKQRNLAYMKNLWLGLEVNTPTGWEQEAERVRELDKVTGERLTSQQASPEGGR